MADLLEERDRDREREEVATLVARLDTQIEARSRALPAYRAARRTQGLADELRSRRDHPVHTLLRRMYFEAR
jgi:hypothetical protein